MSHPILTICAVLAAGVSLGLGLVADEAHSPSIDITPYRRPASPPPAPADNTVRADRVALGKALFFDPRLSRSTFVSCASCHNPSLSWTDATPTAIGRDMKPLRRRTPTLLNDAWAEAFFWDGRAESLEQQALGPITSHDEMDLSLPELKMRLASIPGYREQFAHAYPGEPVAGPVIAKALATFERTIVSGAAPFDRWIAGDSAAIPVEAKRGFALFTGRANCAKCHSGWRFTDDSFHDIGVAGGPTDSGRGAVLRDIDGVQFAFKTPTLRNVALRYPYMHNGSEPTLDAVLDLYDRGGRVHRPTLADEIGPLHLSRAERRALLSFLQTLTADDPPIAAPILPR